MTENYTGIDTFSFENIPLYMGAAKNGCVIAFDTETTGLHNHDDIVELGCVEHERGIMTFEYSVYLRNTVPINNTEASQVNGLTDEFLAEKGEDPKQALSDNDIFRKNGIKRDIFHAVQYKNLTSATAPFSDLTAAIISAGSEVK